MGSSCQLVFTYENSVAHYARFVTFASRDMKIHLCVKKAKKYWFLVCSGQWINYRKKLFGLAVLKKFFTPEHKLDIDHSLER